MINESVLRSIRFIKSAKDLKGCPAPDLPEVAIAGRSNAGKSSFINALGLSLVAKVSGRPGKTRLLNFFLIGDHYRLVDMPGYGYAARSGAEVESWRQMVESYLALRGSLQGLVLIMDIRRQWTAQEQELVDWVSQRSMPVVVVLNKADKVGNNEKAKALRDLKAKAVGVSQVFVVSASKRLGVTEVEEFVFKNWIKQRHGGEA